MTQNPNSPRPNRHQRRHPPKQTAISNPNLPNLNGLSMPEMPKLSPFELNLSPLELAAMNMSNGSSTSSESQNSMPPESVTGTSAPSGASSKRADKFDRLHRSLYEMVMSAGGPMIKIPALRVDGLIICAQAESLVASHVAVARQYPEYYKFLLMISEGSVIMVAVVQTLTLGMMIAAAHGLKIPGIEKLMHAPEKANAPNPYSMLDEGGNPSGAQPVPVVLPPDQAAVRMMRSQVFNEWKAMQENAGVDVQAVPGVHEAAMEAG